MILICQYNGRIVSTGQYSKLTVVRYLNSVSVTCTLVVGQLGTRFGMDVDVLDKSMNFFLVLLIP